MLCAAFSAWLRDFYSQDSFSFIKQAPKVVWCQSLVFCFWEIRILSASSSQQSSHSNKNYLEYFSDVGGLGKGSSSNGVCGYGDNQEHVQHIHEQVISNAEDFFISLLGFLQHLLPLRVKGIWWERK